MKLIPYPIIDHIIYRGNTFFKGSLSMDTRKLIFILSLPRSGSTLLQKLLGNHPQIHAPISEPWIMLHPLYAIRERGIKTEYSADFARIGLEDFIAQVPEGEELFFQAVRNYANTFYQRALEISNKQYILDKTPRYLYIIPELFRVYPQARYIILLRNPLASLSSTLSGWFKNNMALLKESQNFYDLVEGPKRLVEGMEYLGTDALLVHYEDLALKPNETMRYLCQKLDIPFSSRLLNYSLHAAFQPRLGDNYGIVKYNRPVSENVNKWISHLNSQDRRPFAQVYLEALGKKMITNLGYDYAEMKSQLSEAKNHEKEGLYQIPTERSAKNEFTIEEFFEAVTGLIEKGDIERAITLYNQHQEEFRSYPELASFDSLMKNVEKKYARK